MPDFSAVLRQRPRQYAAIAVAVVVYLLAPGDWPLATRFLAAWNIGVALYLVVAVLMFSRSSVETMRIRARREDVTALGILLLLAATAIASLGAIASELAGIRGAGGGLGVRLGLVAATIVGSWFFLQTIFAVHYAHEYYAGRGDAPVLEFPGAEPPDYWDFVYFAVTIGAAAQTSDVTVADRRLRRLVLAHTVLSFFFNTGVLALAVNVGAGLL